MDSIQTALNKFECMTDYAYDFVIAHDKQLHGIRLTFNRKDFHHMVGLYYLNDIAIPKNHKKLFRDINSGEINDEYLSSSKNYLKIKNSNTVVKNRIHDFRYIEQFLDSQNLVFNYVEYMNINSKIDANYMIRSTYNEITAYIFIKERKK